MTPDAPETPLPATESAQPATVAPPPEARAKKKQKRLRKPGPKRKRKYRRPVSPRNYFGRPSKMDDRNTRRQIVALYRLGMNDTQVSAVLGVTTMTIRNWRDKNPDFFAALMKEKAKEVHKVKRSLYARANGYTHPAKKFFCHNGTILEADYIEHYPPDTAAAKLILTNALPDEFKERVEQTTVLQNPDGSPMAPGQLGSNVTIIELPPERPDPAPDAVAPEPETKAAEESQPEVKN